MRERPVAKLCASFASFAEEKRRKEREEHRERKTKEREEGDRAYAIESYLNSSDINYPRVSALLNAS